MSRGKSGPTSARARCGTTNPTQPMTPEVATLAEVTSVAAATIAMRNGPVASPSARASSSGSDITLSRQRSAISTMVPTTTGPISGSRSETVGERIYLQKLLEHFGDKPISQLSQVELDTAASFLFPGRSPATLNRQVYTPVSAVLRHARNRQNGDLPFRGGTNLRDMSRSTVFVSPDYTHFLRT